VSIAKRMRSKHLPAGILLLFDANCEGESSESEYVGQPGSEWEKDAASFFSYVRPQDADMQAKCTRLRTLLLPSASSLYK
jgi:hypothetical protein